METEKKKNIEWTVNSNLADTSHFCYYDKLEKEFLS